MRIKLFDRLAACRFAAAHKRRGQRALIASGQADQAASILAQIIERCRALAFCRFAHLELRDELAEILVALARRAQQRQPRRLACDADAAATPEASSRGPKLDTETSAPICARTSLRFALV